MQLNRIKNGIFGGQSPLFHSKTTTNKHFSHSVRFVYKYMSMLLPLLLLELVAGIWFVAALDFVAGL